MSVTESGTLVDMAEAAYAEHEDGLRQTLLEQFRRRLAHVVGDERAARAAIRMGPFGYDTAIVDGFEFRYGWPDLAVTVPCGNCGYRPEPVDVASLIELGRHVAENGYRPGSPCGLCKVGVLGARE